MTKFGYEKFQMKCRFFNKVKGEEVKICKRKCFRLKPCKNFYFHFHFQSLFFHHTPIIYCQIQRTSISEFFRRFFLSLTNFMHNIAVNVPRVTQKFHFLSLI
jgi:hypothetical protein